MEPMKSILGLIAALFAGAAFAAAYAVSLRAGANWLDAQWLFLAALPYNWAMLHISGESNFSPDAPRQIAAALLFDVIFAYLAGALAESLLRGALRLVRHAKSPA